MGRFRRRRAATCFPADGCGGSAERAKHTRPRAGRGDDEESDCEYRPDAADKHPDKHNDRDSNCHEDPKHRLRSRDGNPQVARQGAPVIVIDIEHPAPDAFGEAGHEDDEKQAGDSSLQVAKALVDSRYLEHCLRDPEVAERAEQAAANGRESADDHVGQRVD